jgi:hypothetical protein
MAKRLVPVAGDHPLSDAFPIFRIEREDSALNVEQLVSDISRLGEEALKKKIERTKKRIESEYYRQQKEEVAYLKEIQEQAVRMMLSLQNNIPHDQCVRLQYGWADKSEHVKRANDIALIIRLNEINARVVKSEDVIYIELGVLE